MEGGRPDHILGTDHLGRDYLSRLLYGARVSLGVGFGVALVAGLIGTTLGLLAGYFGGQIDMAISFLITWRLALPVVLVALAAVALGGASLRNLILVLGLLLWDRFAVVVRATTQSLRAREFVTAAQALGASHSRILDHRASSKHHDPADRRRHARSCECHPLGGCAFLSGARRKPANALMGADDRRRTGAHPV